LGVVRAHTGTSLALERPRLAFRFCVPASSADKSAVAIEIVPAGAGAALG
jgi:hypothetical protein